MHSAETNRRKHRPNISNAGAAFDPTKLTLAIVSALLLVMTAARPAQAQTETVLYNFTGGSDGSVPQLNLPLTPRATFMGRPH
jgi:hypothetical protein